MIILQKGVLQLQELSKNSLQFSLLNLKECHYFCAVGENFLRFETFWDEMVFFTMSSSMATAI